MLTMQQIKADPERVIARLAVKGFDGREPITRVIALDDRRRELQLKSDNAAAELNRLAATIGAHMKAGRRDEAEQAKAAVAELKESQKALADGVAQAEADIRNILLNVPNLPCDMVPEGLTAADNVVEKEGGPMPDLPADALPHWDLARKYNLIDFDLGVKITGAGFPVYLGKGAKLQRALIQFFLDSASEAGYLEVQPPYVVNEASGYGTGQLPDKEAQMYVVTLDNLYLIPTAEVPVTNLYRDVIIPADKLPIKNCAYSACFRREAGSYGKDVRGLNRLHQFDKVEIVRIEKPENSYAALEEMKDHVQSLLDRLGLPLAHPAPVRRRHVLHFGNHLRLRGVVGRPETLARGFFRIELRDLPGQPPQMPLPRRGPQDPPVPHPQRLGTRAAPHHGRAARELPDARRHRGSRGAPPIHRLRHHRSRRLLICSTKSRQSWI